VDVSYRVFKYDRPFNKICVFIVLSKHVSVYNKRITPYNIKNVFAFTFILEINLPSYCCNGLFHPALTVVFFPDRVSKLKAPCTKCTVLYSEKITANKADSSAYG